MPMGDLLKVEVEMVEVENNEKKKNQKFNPENRVCRANHGGGEANDQWR